MSDYKKTLAKLKRLIARNGGFQATLIRQYDDDGNKIYVWSIFFDLGLPLPYTGYLNQINTKKKPTLEHFFNIFLNEALNHCANFRSFGTHFADLVDAGTRPHVLITYAQWTQINANMETLSLLFRMAGYDWVDFVVSYRNQSQESDGGA